MLGYITSETQVIKNDVCRIGEITTSLEESISRIETKMEEIMDRNDCYLSKIENSALRSERLLRSFNEKYSKILNQLALTKYGKGDHGKSSKESSRRSRSREKSEERLKHTKRPKSLTQTSRGKTEKVTSPGYEPGSFSPIINSDEGDQNLENNHKKNSPPEATKQMKRNISSITQSNQSPAANKITNPKIKFSQFNGLTPSQNFQSMFYNNQNGAINSNGSNSNTNNTGTEKKSTNGNNYSQNDSDLDFAVSRASDPIFEGIKNKINVAIKNNQAAENSSCKKLPKSEAVKYMNEKMQPSESEDSVEPGEFRPNKNPSLSHLDELAQKSPVQYIDSNCLNSEREIDLSGDNVEALPSTRNEYKDLDYDDFKRAFLKSKNDSFVHLEKFSIKSENKNKTSEFESSPMAETVFSYNDDASFGQSLQRNSVQNNMIKTLPGNMPPLPVVVDWRESAKKVLDQLEKHELFNEISSNYFLKETCEAFLGAIRDIRSSLSEGQCDEPQDFIEIGEELLSKIGPKAKKSGNKVLEVINSSKPFIRSSFRFLCLENLPLSDWNDELTSNDFTHQAEFSNEEIDRDFFCTASPSDVFYVIAHDEPTLNLNLTSRQKLRKIREMVACVTNLYGNDDQGPDSLPDSRKFARMLGKKHSRNVIGLKLPANEEISEISDLLIQTDDDSEEYVYHGDIIDKMRKAAMECVYPDTQENLMENTRISTGWQYELEKLIASWYTIKIMELISAKYIVDLSKKALEESKRESLPICFDVEIDDDSEDKDAEDGTLRSSESEKSSGQEEKPKIDETSLECIKGQYSGE